MAALLVAFVILLAVTAVFVVRPLLVEEDAEGASDLALPKELSREERDVIEREVLWRLEHDLAAGRIGSAEYEAEVARLATRAGTLQAAGD